MIFRADNHLRLIWTSWPMVCKNSTRTTCCRLCRWSMITSHRTLTPRTTLSVSPPPYLHHRVSILTRVHRGRIPRRPVYPPRRAHQDAMGLHGGARLPVNLESISVLGFNSDFPFSSSAEMRLRSLVHACFLLFSDTLILGS